MSDALPIVSGSFQSQETGLPANTQGKSASRSGNEQFPALFQSVMQDEVATSTSTDLLLAPMLDPVEFSFLNPDAGVAQTAIATQDPNMTMAAYSSLPFIAADTGNDLPQLSWSGYVAVADNEGAAALALEGDQDNSVSSKPVFARDLPNAILKAQQQVANAQLQQAAVPMSEETDFSAVLNKEGLPALHMERQFMLENAPTQLQTNTTTIATPQHAMLNDISAVVGTSARGGENNPQQINLPVQHPQWAQHVGDRVQWMVGQNLQQAEIRLNPPELGALEVRIQVQGDQASVNFSSPHAAVRDALDAAMPRLREMMQAHGLTLGDVNVSGQALAQHQSRDSGMNGSGQQAQGSGGGHSDEVTSIESLPSLQSAIKPGLLDVYA